MTPVNAVKAVALILLDLSAAFHTTDNFIWLDLKDRFGVDGLCLYG